MAHICAYVQDFSPAWHMYKLTYFLYHGICTNLRLCTNLQISLQWHTYKLTLMYKLTDYSLQWHMYKLTDFSPVWHMPYVLTYRYFSSYKLTDFSQPWHTFINLQIFLYHGACTNLPAW